MKIVRDVMTPKIVYCFEDQGVEEALQVMKENQIRRLPILNEQKQVIGIISLGDLATDTNDKESVGKTLDRISRPE
jgi:CBS domain-containing protein